MDQRAEGRARSARFTSRAAARCSSTRGTRASAVVIDRAGAHGDRDHERGRREALGCADGQRITRERDARAGRADRRAPSTVPGHGRHGGRLRRRRPRTPPRRRAACSRRCRRAQPRGHRRRRRRAAAPDRAVRGQDRRRPSGRRRDRRAARPERAHRRLHRRRSATPRHAARPARSSAGAPTAPPAPTASSCPPSPTRARSRALVEGIGGPVNVLAGPGSPHARRARGARRRADQRRLRALSRGPRARATASPKAAYERRRHSTTMIAAQVAFADVQRCSRTDARRGSDGSTQRRAWSERPLGLASLRRAPRSAPAA